MFKLSSVWPGLASNLLSCFNLPSARTAGVNYHTSITTALRCTMNNKESNSRHPRAGNIVGHLFLGYIHCVIKGRELRFHGLTETDMFGTTAK